MKIEMKMKTKTKTWFREVASIVAAVSAVGCGIEDDLGSTAANSVTPERISDEANPIVAEIPRGGAEVVARRYRNADVALASYATFGIGGCSATMIGPNVMMTAAHCAGMGNTSVAYFRAYREQNASSVGDFENFTCHHLLQTWHSSDFMLYFCDPNARGENPGDKYGYLDFERAEPTVGMPLYSIWYNPLETPAPRREDVRFYSEGRITSVTGRGTFTMDPGLTATVPLDRIAANMSRFMRPIAVESNLYTIGGASGSAQISATSHRVVVGPTAQGSPGFRTSLSINQYLRDGTVEPRDPTRVTQTYVRDTFGLDPQRYFGLIDKNRNRLFDIQEDIERVRGEAQRDHYWLGFDSERRNNLWRVGTGTRIDAAARIAAVDVPWRRTLLIHNRLNLRPYSTYRVSVMTRVFESDKGGGLAFRMLNAPDYSWGWWPTDASEAVVAVEPHADWRITTFLLATGAEPSALEIVSLGRLRGEIMALSLVATDSVMDFDSGDKRANWRNENNGQRALILPDGRESNGTPNWAALVTRDPRISAGRDFSLRNRQLALLANRWQRVCFDARAYRGDFGPYVGDMRVVSGGSEIRRTAFQPGANWSETCSWWFYPTSSDNNVMFGVDSAAPNGEQAYLVDNIRLELY